MSDLVERLRSAGPGGWNAEVADEIERLQSQLVKARNALEEISHQALAYASDEDAVEWCHSIHKIAQDAVLIDEMGNSK